MHVTVITIEVYKVAALCSVANSFPMKEQKRVQTVLEETVLAATQHASSKKIMPKAFSTLETALLGFRYNTIQ